MMAIYYRETLPENVNLLASGMDQQLSALSHMVGPIIMYIATHFFFNCVADSSETSCGTTATVIVGAVCSLVFLSVGVLLGVVSVYLILRVRGRLSGPPAATYDEVGVAGGVSRSHDIQLTSNEAYDSLNKNNIPTSHNTAYGRVQL